MPPRAASRSCCAGSAATRPDRGRSLRWPPSRGARAVAHRALGGGVVRRARRARRLVPVRLRRSISASTSGRTHGSNCASRSGSSGRGVPSGGPGRRRSCRGCRSTGIRTCWAGASSGSGWDGATVYAEKNWGPRFTEHWWWGQAQAFEGADACVAFAGGRVLGGAPTGGGGAGGGPRAAALAAVRARGERGGRGRLAGPRPLAALVGRDRGRGRRARRRSCPSRCPASAGSSRARSSTSPGRCAPRPAGGGCGGAASRRSPASSGGSREPANGGWVGKGSSASD